MLKFVSLEICPVLDMADCAESYRSIGDHVRDVQGAIASGHAFKSYWSLYGVDMEGRAHCIGDYDSGDAARSHALALGLPFTQSGCKPFTPADPFAPARLFNCCTDHAAPDWSQFDAIEIHGCVDLNAETPEQGTHFESGYDRDEATCFSVSGHYRDGGAESITDCDTLEEAESVARLFSAFTGYPVNSFC